MAGETTGREVFLTIAGVAHTITVTEETTTHAVVETLRGLSGAGPNCLLSLYDSDGWPVNITALPSNVIDRPYRLEVTGTNGMLIDEVTLDLMALENRVAELEKQLDEDTSVLPPVIQGLKQDVEMFRNKLQNTKHLSWLNCYKDLPPTCRRLQYRRLSDARQKIIREKFLQICEDSISDEVRQCLRLPSFDCNEWSDEEVLLLLQSMFLDLQLPTKFNIDMSILRNFLFQVYKNYNEVPFHNFRHCFCVTQMMYAMAWRCDLPSRIGDLEILILLISCICHDLDHPGYNNIYQINARTELALRYNDISPLENHHCSMAFRILELPECNIFTGFDAETYRCVREGIIRCILATDMARHNQILDQFKDAVEEGFDYSNKSHVNLLCMVLIKVADISNEARPMEVAEPWLDKLLQEFFTQSDAEKEEGLPVTPFMDRDKITKPSSQCSFIGFVLLPLFEALGDLLTDLQEMIVFPVREALDYYRRLNEVAKDEQRQHRKSIVAAELSSLTGATVSVPSSPTRPNCDLVKSNSTNTANRKTSCTFSQTLLEEYELDDGISEEVIGEISETSSDQEETVTEVAVSEKTLKFKISTESSSSGRKSYPGSRKGSREKNHQLAEQDIARVLRDQDRSFRSSDSGEKRSWSSGDQSYSHERCENCEMSCRHESRSYSLADQDWRKDKDNSKKVRSISAGSPEGIREFRTRDMKDCFRKSSPNSPKEIVKKEDGLGTIGEGVVSKTDIGDEENILSKVRIVLNSSEFVDNIISNEKCLAAPLEPNITQVDEKEEERTQKKQSNKLMRRLRNLGDVFSRSTTSDNSLPKNCVDKVEIPASPASLKNTKVVNEKCLEGDRRAMTLPKISRKKYMGSRKEKGWKTLLKSKTGKEEATGSGTEEEKVVNGLTPPEEMKGCLADAAGLHNNNRKPAEAGITEHAARSERHHWMSSLVSSFRSKRSAEKDTDTVKT